MWTRSLRIISQWQHGVSVLVQAVMLRYRHPQGPPTAPEPVSSTKPVHEHEDDYFGDVNNNDDSDDGDKNHNDDDNHDENDNGDTNTNPDHSAFYTTPSPARYSSSIAEVTIKGFL